MVDAQRAEGLGVLAGGLAHDFNNLLVAVIGNADLALREIPQGTPGPRRDREDPRCRAARGRADAISCSTCGGRGPAGTTRVYPAGVVEEMVRIIAPSMPATIRCRDRVRRRSALRGDPAQLRQVMLNLITNARDALARPAATSRSAHASVAHDGRSPSADDVLTPQTGAYVEIAVADDGPGMSDEVRRHVFDPFFTTKEHGHGIGLAARARHRARTTAVGCG